MDTILNIMDLPAWLMLIFGSILIYLIVKRIQIKKTEDFEDRDN